jgi:Ca-activated chloride channel family protein
VRFNDPLWLVAGLMTCIALIAMWYRYDARQQAALAAFVAPQLRRRLTGSVSRAARLVQRGLLLASVLCLFAALAGPELGYHWEQISRRGNEVVFAIDTSRSMLTPDVKPSRMTRAKLAINDMARQLDDDGIGLLAFAGSAFLVCPLTLDHGAFQQSLDAVDVHTIPLGGTNIPGAIQAARAALARHPGRDRILILVTDGENLEGDATAAAREAAMQDGLKIFTVGIGTGEGDLIPLPADQGGGFVKDDKGTLVRSHLDEEGLKAIAAATGGAYVHVAGQGEDFEAFLNTVFGTVSKHDLSYRQRKVYTQRYQWPLAASLILLLASLMVGTRRAGRRRTAAVSAALALLPLTAALLLPIRSESADQPPAPAGASDAGAPRLEYNVGTSAYRAGNFSGASQAFQKSIATAPDSDAQRLADQEDAYYNLGNALYRAGQLLEKSSPEEAKARWNDAVKAYETALQLRSDDADSRYNRDFVKRKIDALKKPPDQDGGGGGGGGKGGGGGQGGGKGGGGGQGGGGGKGGGGNQGGGGQGQPPPRGPGSGAPPPSPGQQAGSPPGNPPPGGAQAGPQPASARAGGSPGDEGRQAAEDRRTPGQMSVAEARELLDSAKSDEHHSLPVPAGPRPPASAPDKAKNW